jgi:cyclophilin family peptidyl-prolyl cis-trans isomerase
MVSMARTNGPNTVRGNFVIHLSDDRRGDRNSTVIGRVVSGMEHVSTMTRTGEGSNDTTKWTPILCPARARIHSRGPLNLAIFWPDALRDRPGA